jgi:cytochrome P450
MSTDMTRPALDEVDFFDPATNDCPYDAYETLREEAPVWVDPRMGFYVISRYDDVKMALLDTERFSNKRNKAKMTPVQEQVFALYKAKGWVPAPTLAGRLDPEHKELRGLFNHAFRPKKIRELDGFLDQLADQLFDRFIDNSECDWVREFAIPLPLLMIGKQMGANDDDIWQIKAWTDAWVQRLGMMQTEEEALWSTEMEIEAQHYFQPIFERLREQPDDTLLSDLVNTVIPEWGRPLNDNELHAEMMGDTFVGGSETSTNAISAGVRLLIENPDQWDKLKSDPETYLPVLGEEVLRLEGPVQSLFRQATVDIELHGTTIPAGAMVNIRYAAANRDTAQFDCPADMNLDRDDVRNHLAFGFGIHHCLGAPLARRELYYAFKALVERVDEMWFLDDQNDFKIAPNYCLRALEHLHIGFTPSTR